MVWFDEEKNYIRGLTKKNLFFTRIRDSNNIPVGDLWENQEIVIAKSVKRNFYIALEPV